MSCQMLESWWSDAGTFDSLLKASSLVAKQKLCTCSDSNQPQLPKVGAMGEFGGINISDK